MAIVRAPFPRLQFKADDGSLMSFCWLKVFMAGTNTQIRTYKTESGTLNPIEIQLDNRGECDVWLDDDKKYRFELWSIDRKRLLKIYDGVLAGTGSVASHTTDVIKWSDVLAVQDSDYSEFTARIAADIVAGVAPVVLDDVNEGAVAVLDNVNAGGALFITQTTCDERDVIYTNYVITDVAISRTTNTKNLLFKNSSNAYGADADGFVEVKNNRNGVYTYSGNTGANSLDFLADFDSTGAVPSVRFSDANPPNFAVKITSTAQTSGTANVYKKQNGIYTPLKPSVAGGTTVEAGKTYQLTCVGDCWTLAEFEEPSVGLKTKIAGKLYNVVKIGSLYWMAENLDYKWDGLIHPTLDDSETDPIANYYGYDGNGSEQPYVGNGLLYNGVAALYLQAHSTELGLGDWRVPTLADWTALITNAGGDSTATQALKSSNGWNAGYDGGTDDLGFSAIGNGGFTAGYTNPVSSFTYINLGDAATFLTSTISSDDLLYNVTLWHNDAPQMSYPAPKYFGGALRLCMDA